jgi:hypothetical protein
MPFFLVVVFVNNMSDARSNKLVGIMSKFLLVEMLLQQFHYLFNAEVSCQPILVGFQIIFTRSLDGTHIWTR